MEREHPELQCLIAEAVCNEAFRDSLLNGDRSQAIKAFALTEQEREAVLTIQADTIQTFAQGVLDWIERNNDIPFRSQPHSQTSARLLPRLNARI